jgi:rSAM/selenodomain-associated transferase 2
MQQIIVVDGGSTDNTVSIARDAGVTVATSLKKGRAAQMNFGASLAKGDVLYFLHADTYPPQDFLADIRDAVSNGYGAGCYRLSFDHPHWFLKANCWFTRFDVNAFRFGDQSLFVTKKLFDSVGGFKESHVVLEDQELVKRLKKKSRLIIISKTVITSARKYRENGIYKTQAIFFFIYALYRLGLSQSALVKMYRRLIRQDKL